MNDPAFRVDSVPVGRSWQIRAWLGSQQIAEVNPDGSARLAVAVLPPAVDWAIRALFGNLKAAEARDGADWPEAPTGDPWARTVQT